jgi:septum site-determining protein MinC
MVRRRQAPAATSTLASAGVALPQTAAARAVPVGIATLYHRGTLRGGQALHNLGNLVVIGDVNPGAELVASGDIVVFGALRGVAHAGAQGDRSARVIALELAPTQLRIATLIATSDSGTRARGPEHASIVDERIVVVPFAEADLRREHTS